MEPYLRSAARYPPIQCIYATLNFLPKGRAARGAPFRELEGACSEQNYT